jgi:ATP-dependent Clp protease adaptor protein ClpS
VAEYIGTPGRGAALKDKQKVSRPKRYKVLLLNDHYTTMEFVVEILIQVFRRSQADAVRIMLSVHENGMGVAGVYIKSIAETKVKTVHEMAREMEFPLRCTLEPE